MIALSTNERGWYGNLVLLPEPPPYGTWQRIDLEISGLMRTGAQPENRLGGRYRMIGRAVLGEDWKYLEGEWDYRNTISVVNYSEKRLDVDALIDELFNILTDDGPKPKPEPRPRQGPSDRLRWPEV